MCCISLTLEGCGQRSHGGSFVAINAVLADLKNKKKEVQNWKSEKSIFHFSVVWQMESPFLQSRGLVTKKGDRSFILLHGRFPVYLWFD